MSTKRKSAPIAGATVKRRQTIPVAPNVKRYVKGCMSRLIEKKYLNQPITVTNISATGTVQSAALFNITQGTGDSSRTGNIIKVGALWFNLTFTDTVMNVIRAVLLWDRQPNGAGAGVSDVLVTSDINSAFNPNTVIGHGGKRFKVILDTQLVINPPIAATNTPARYNRRLTFAGGGVPVVYGGNAGTVADMTTNNLFWVLVSSSGTCDLNGNLQIKFTDN